MMHRSMLRIALMVLLILAGASPAWAQNRYRVTLELMPGDDGAAVARQLAATYRGRLEPYAEEGFTGFAVTMSEASVRLLSTDPRVARVEQLSAIAAPQPTPSLPEVAPVTAPPVRVEETGSTLTMGPYAYDGVGNIKSVGTNLPFVYDGFGRLTSGTVAAGRTQSYTYDAFGNLRTITTDGTVISIGADPATNRLSRPHDPVTGQAYNVSAQYDAAGNLTSADALGSFVYDGTGMVKESTNAQSVRTVYVYTPDDERIATVRPGLGKWDYTVRGPDQKVLRRISRTGSNWSWEEDYVYRGGTLLAAEVPGPDKTLHFHVDHLGTPRLITGNGGAEVSRHTYFPFGAEVQPAPQSPERMRFTGHERDDTNLDYMHARYYGVGMGRFLSVDPYLDLHKATRYPQNWNRYAYVRNNPINLVDPDGRDDVNTGPDFEVAGAPHPEKDREFRKEVTDRVVGGISVVIATVFLGGGPEIGDGERPKGTTKPTLPDKTLASDGKVTIEHYYKSGDHPPAHAHVRGGGADTRIGPNGKPATKADAPMTRAQQKVYDANKSQVRRAINKIGRWLAWVL